MIKISFSSYEIKELQIERFQYPHPRIQKRMDALYLKSQGISHKDICRICNITRKTLVEWLNMYIKDRINGLKQWNYKGKTSELSTFEEIIKESLEKNPVRSVNEAIQRIENLTGIKRRPTQVSNLMKKLGFCYRKIGTIPGKAITKEKQKEQFDFLENELNPRLEEAKQGKRKVFFWTQLTLSTEHS